jgi:Fe-S-cluster-containing hydrogenase component 2
VTDQLTRTGVADAEDIATKLPDAGRMARQAFAIFECFAEIPCDPCTKACPRGAVLPMADINDTPVVDFEKCNGCAMCVSKCPGLANFVVDLSGDEAIVKIPYELTPLPMVGDSVLALDRSGQFACDAVVSEVRAAKVLGKTNVVGLRVPKEYAMAVRHFRARRADERG